MLSWAIEGKNRFVNNSIKSFENMTLQRWIRIILIVGAYLLIRPYLLKGAANRHKRLAAQDAEDLGLNTTGVTNANDWRGAKKRKGAAGVGATSAGAGEGTVDGVGKARK